MNTSKSFFNLTSFEKSVEDKLYYDKEAELAKNILKIFMKFRRTPTSVALCELSCPLCTSPHLKKVINALKREKPVTFVLPAFPGKSPNPDKVLGTLPDMAEHRALCFLQELCDKIKSIYSPGAHIILCSDGRVFSDIVGMREDDVTDYQYELDQMIEELELKNISTFNLDALYKGNDFVQMRQHLMERFGKSLESLQEKVRQGGKHSKNPEDIEAHRMYLGITRFLLEDSLYPGQTKSRSALQKECRKKAYEVILRSNAWSELISCQMPNSVRLSIHPQICGAKKLGIRLVGSETWMTPWHGVAVKTNEGFILLKQTEAKALGARLVHSLNGRPSHYELATQHDQKF